MSHNPHLKETQRLEKTFKEYMSENKSKFDQIDNYNKEIEADLDQIRDKIYENIRRNCKVQFEWLEKHGTIRISDQGMQVHVNENPDGISADAILGELDVCASKNDLGLKDFFDRTNLKKAQIMDNNKSCINKCTFRSEEKTEKEIKNCVQSCFGQSFNSTDKLLIDIREKLKDVKGNLH